MVGVNSSTARAAACAALVLLAACTTQQKVASDTGEILFTGSIDALMPLHDGDVFLYRATDRRGEHLRRSQLSALQRPGELRVTLTKGDAVVAYMHLRREDNTIAVVSEMDVTSDFGLRYDPPLPLFQTPVRAGERRAHAKVDVFRPSDGSRVSSGEVEVIVSSVREAGGDVVISAERRLSLSDRRVVIEETRWLRPGVGEVRLQAAANGVVAERHELLCATIAGKQIGTCPEP